MGQVDLIVVEFLVLYLELLPRTRGIHWATRVSFLRCFIWVIWPGNKLTWPQRMLPRRLRSLILSPSSHWFLPRWATLGASTPRTWCIMRHTEVTLVLSTIHPFRSHSTTLLTCTTTCPPGMLHEISGIMVMLVTLAIMEAVVVILILTIVTDVTKHHFK